MLLRDANGKINIISRSSYNTEGEYNQEIYKIYYTYTRSYKTAFEYNLLQNNNRNNTEYKINTTLDEDNDDEY
jgi:hypothetical protein